MSVYQGAGTPSLFTDLYELNMAQALVADGMTGEAEFELFFRDAGGLRGYTLLTGIEAVLTHLEHLHFTAAEVAYLETLGRFDASFLEWLQHVRFRGDVDAMAEGSIAFPKEPVLRLRAPLPLAQIVETQVINAVNHASLVATKAARIVDAAAGANVVDFGARRAHGAGAAFTAARASWIGGCAGTSNMVAGQHLDLPVVGTMAHSYVQSFARELDAFRAFTRHHPDTVLLVDTYDTLRGVERVIELAAEQGEDFRVRGIRIDSGDLGALAQACRQKLDAAGLHTVGIIVSGALNEYRIRDLVADGAPVDGFGVGTDLVVSRDLPSLDLAYKLVQYDGRGTLKASPDKATLPGPKQVFRDYAAGIMCGDTIARVDENPGGEALLQPAMRAGKRCTHPVDAHAAREHAHHQRERLPGGLRTPDAASAPYPVRVSARLQADADAAHAAAEN